MHRSDSNDGEFHMHEGSFDVPQIYKSFEGLATLFPCPESWGEKKWAVFALPGGVFNSMLAKTHKELVDLSTPL